MAITYSGQFVGSGIGFGIQVVLQRAMGPAEYGILGLATTVGALAGMLGDLGICHAMVRFGSRYLEEDETKAHAHFAAAMSLRVALTSIVTLVGYLLARWIALDLYDKPNLESPLNWVFLGLMGGTLYNYWQFLAQSYQSFTLRGLVHASMAVVRAVGVGLLLFMSLITPTSMIMLDATINLMSFGVGMFLSPRGIWRAKWHQIRAAARELVPFSAFTGIMFVGATIFETLDTLMLGVYCDEVTVGLYRAAVTYSMVLTFLTMSVSNVLFPRITAMSNARELGRFMRRVARFTVGLAVLTIPYIFIVRWWIPWYEVQYADATSVFYILYIGFVLDMQFSPIGFAMLSVDRPGTLALMAIFNISVNFAGNYWLIPIYGAHGAAIATVAARLISGLLGIYLIVTILEDKARDELTPAPDD